MPACGSPWLFAAYHVFLRRPVPWHPPCALSNLIVTKLSSCQRIDFSIFDSFFLLRPTAKLFAFYCACANLHYRFRNWFLYKMFSIWLCSFQGTSEYRVLRSLKTIQFKEDFRQSTRPLCFSLRGFLGSSPLQSFDCQQTHSLALVCLYRPGMSNSLSCLALSLERR